MHVLEAGDAGRPALLLLHGFPGTRLQLAQGHGAARAGGLPRDRARPARLRAHDGWDGDYDGDLASFRLTNLVRDADISCCKNSDINSVEAVIGHDFGSPVAAWCALLHPEIFKSVALMSAPFAGPPADAPTPPPDPVHDALAALPRPRKHYQWYYSTREADADMQRCPQGVHAFLRAYYHVKSADWKENQPVRTRGVDARTSWRRCRPTTSWTLGENMAQTVAPHMPAPADRSLPRGSPTTSCASTAPNSRAPDSRAALQWYRCGTSGRFNARTGASTPAARSRCRPASSPGKSDWGPYQRPGALAKMQRQRLRARPRLPFRRRRRPLGAAGAARGSRAPAACSSCGALAAVRGGSGATASTSAAPCSAAQK